MSCCKYFDKITVVFNTQEITELGQTQFYVALSFFNCVLEGKYIIKSTG